MSTPATGWLAAFLTVPTRRKALLSPAAARAASAMRRGRTLRGRGERDIAVLQFSEVGFANSVMRTQFPE
jgi:hypothetical protein